MIGKSKAETQFQNKPVLKGKGWFKPEVRLFCIIFNTTVYSRLRLQTNNNCELELRLLRSDRIVIERLWLVVKRQNLLFVSLYEDFIKICTCFFTNTKNETIIKFHS